MGINFIERPEIVNEAIEFVEWESQYHLSEALNDYITNLEKNYARLTREMASFICYLHRLQGNHPDLKIFPYK